MSSLMGKPTTVKRKNVLRLSQNPSLPRSLPHDSGPLSPFSSMPSCSAPSGRVCTCICDGEPAAGNRRVRGACSACVHTTIEGGHGPDGNRHSPAETALYSKIFTIFEGTSEIQRMLIGRALTGLGVR